MKQKILNGVRFCKCCGARMLFQGYNIQNRFAHTMNKEGICYDCAYWKDIIAYPPDHLEIVGDLCMKVYPVSDKSDKSVILGGRGKMRYFRRPDHSLFTSNDVWVIGKIPGRFKSEFKTTAIEISLNTYRRLTKDNRKCKARACFDRYHCFRYDLALEDDDMGAYNSVPTNWVPGDEHCKYFMDMGKLSLTDEGSVIK